MRRTLAFALTTAAMLSACFRDFSRFADGGPADSNTPHFEAPVTLCPENSAPQTRVRFVNISRWEDTACLRINGVDHSVSHDTTQPTFTSDTTASGEALTDIADPHGIGIWFESSGQCNDYASYLPPPPTVDLTRGGVYSLIRLNTLNGYSQWQLVREMNCITLQRVYFQVVNGTDLSLTLYYPGLRSLEVTPVGIDVSARPERNNIDFDLIDGGAEPFVFSITPEGSQSAFYFDVTRPSAGRYLFAIERTGDDTFDAVICPQDEVFGGIGDRRGCERTHSRQ